MDQQPSELTPAEREWLETVVAQYTPQELYEAFRDVIELVKEMKIQEAKELEKWAETGEVPFFIQPPLFGDWIGKLRIRFRRKRRTSN